MPKRNLFAEIAEGFDALATQRLQHGNDAALFDIARQGAGDFRVPATVLNAILEGAHPVKAWREHRGMTQELLAEQAGISKAYLCQTETGKRVGAVKTLKSIAKVLSIRLDDLQD
jgi:DNA-binding XRE family transcriptional regulator